MSFGRIALLFLAAVSAFAWSAAPALANHTATARAYGVSADIVGVATEVAPTPLSVLPPGSTQNAAMLNLGVGTLATVTTGAVSATTSADTFMGHARANAFANVANAVVTAPIIGAQVFGIYTIQSSCTAFFNGTGVATTAGTEIISGNLTIGSTTLMAGAQATQTILLGAGVIGSVVVNEVIPLTNGVRVNTLHITLVSGAAPTDIIIGSSECLLTPATPVQLRSFSARPTRQGALLSWRTASEHDVLGFHVYRQQAGKLVRLNRSLIAARRPHGAGYSFLDRSARGPKLARYRLQVVHLDGRRSWFGTS